MQDNYISYSGKVRTRKYRRGALVRERRLVNEGTSALFRLICDCLYQNPLSERRPQFIDICYNTGSGFVSILTNPVSIVNTSIVSNSGSVGLSNINTSSVSIIFSVNVSSGHISPAGAPPGSGNVYFVLRDSTAEEEGTSGEVLAYVADTTLAENFGIALDEVYIVDWTLTVGNQPQSQG